ncbi:MAG: cell division protein FtsZ, partial [Candidatus Aenigmatarchaeota archaeon]
IIIPNDKLLDIVPDVSLTTAFKIADEILVNSVKGIVELITKPGLINLDLADVKAVMRNGGLAMVGMGESDSEDRAFEAVEKALANPLLDLDIEGATGALINVTGGKDLTTREAQDVVESISSRLNEDAKIIWGAMLEPELGDTLRVMVVITGAKAKEELEKVERMVKKRSVIEEELGIQFLE